MFNLTTRELEAYIEDDLPYFDLTTHLQDIQGKKAQLSIFTREEIMVSCSEEAAKIAVILGCEVEQFLPSKTIAKEGETLITFSGDYNDVHQAWRNVQVILEYSSKIATYTHQMKQEIDAVNSHCELLGTRKSFPFAKRFCIKSIVVGGGMPHRLGLSETILIFGHHRKVYESIEVFYASIATFKRKAPEKKIVVESEEMDDVIQLMRAGVDVIQLDKVTIETAQEAVAYRDAYYPSIKILLAGGVNKNNARSYAALGIDGIVTSSIYNAGMANLGSRMELIEE